MDVFLGGSRHLSYIPSEVVFKIEDLINSGALFLVGDAPGTDAAFQEHLRRIGCRDVKVFTSAFKIRNNLGQWPIQQIDSGLKSKSAAAHAFKDRHMADICDFGIMIWDGVSPGTLSNMIDLIEKGKDSYVYFVPDQDFFKIDSISSLEQFELRFPEVYGEAQKRLKAFQKRLKTRSKVKPETLF